MTNIFAPELPLFPEISHVIPDPIPRPCGYPYFLVAYWPRGGYWSIKEPLAFDRIDHPRLLTIIKNMQVSGWTHITVMRLPEGPWLQSRE